MGNSSRYISQKNSPNTNSQTIGGKAMQLRGISPQFVPDWVVITADCPEDRLPNIVYRAWGKVFDEAKYNKAYFQTFAVRSSALEEDGENQSFAGIFESKLNVHPTGLEHAVREVRDSANAARSEAYLQSIGKVMKRNDEYFPKDISPNIAVIIMPMVKAKYSGVLFTKEPVEGTNRMLLEWEDGVGGVVDGTSNSKQVFLTTEKFSIDPIGHGPIGGYGPLSKIWTEAKRLENNYRRPVDIEWAIDESLTPWILQVRPITAGVAV